MTHTTRLLAVFAAVLGTAATTAAQPKRPQATVTPVSVARAIAPGDDVELELKVRLPADVHVQSNAPSDPFFIPTVLTIEAPAGLTVQRVVYPPSQTLKQAGLAEPLVVFGSEFSLRARLAVGADVTPGELVVPARLRYQACDATTCYPPARAETRWTVRVAPKR